MFRQMLMASALRLHDPREPVAGDQDFDDAADEFDEFDEDQDEDDQGDEDQDTGDVDDREDEQEGEQQRQPTRGENRVARLARETAEARAEAAAARREADELRQQRQTAQPSETQAQRQERLAAMTEGQRLEYLLNESNANTQAQLAQIKFESWDTGDRSEFKALCAANPAVAKLADKVEDALRQMRSTGQNASRETVAKYLLGEMALSRAPRAAAKGARTAAAGRERQQGRPGAGRSDTAAPSGRKGGDERAQRRARLENVEI